MENKISKKIKILLVAILLLFLIPLGFDFVKSFPLGFTAPSREKRLTDESGVDHHVFFVDIEPTNNKAMQQIGDDSKFICYEKEGELFIAGKNSSVWWILALKSFVMLALIIALVWFFIVLFRFFSKFSIRGVLAEDNIYDLNLMAYLLGFFSLGFYMVQIMETLWLRSHIVLDGYKIVFPFPPSSLIVAMIILVMAEILKFGYKLQQEQELTI